MKSTKMIWPIRLSGKCRLMNGKDRTVLCFVEGAGDAHKAILEYMLKKPRAFEWYGCEVLGITPLGQRINVIVEPQ